MNLQEITPIVSFLNSISFIYKVQNNGWIQALCPFCDDATRKTSRITHGHFYISNTFNFCQCFRCNHSSSLSKALLSLGFNDKESLRLLTKDNSEHFTYYLNKLNTKKQRLHNITEYLYKYYDSFESKYPNEFIQFKQYIYKRCLGINPLMFFIKPTILENKYLVATFHNINGDEITSRYITKHKKHRYYIPPNRDKTYYYFEDIYSIDERQNIVITEGGFDLINLYNYWSDIEKDKSFYIAIGGKQFNKIIRELLCNYLLIGNYNFKVILDNDKGFKPTKLIWSCKNIITQFNPFCSVDFYQATLSKDVSDLMLLDKIS